MKTKHSDLKITFEEETANGYYGKWFTAKCSECDFTYTQIYRVKEDDPEKGRLDETFQKELEKTKGYEMTCNQFSMASFFNKSR